MRIAFVSQEYPPETAHGGIATQTAMKAAAMAARGHAVWVVSHGRAARQERVEAGITVIRVPGLDGGWAPRTEEIRWAHHSVRVAAELARLRERTPLDLVDFPEYGGEAWAHLVERGPRDETAVTVQLHGPLVMLANTIGWPDRASELYRVGTMMEEASVRLADAVYSSSRCSARWCAAAYGLDLERTPILHTGVDTRTFAPGPAARPGEPPAIAFVGRVAASKGADMLVRAAIRLLPRFPGLRLHLVGRGDPGFVAGLRAEAAAAGLALELAGPLPREALPARLAAADVLAAPSIYEGGPGFVILEALACGIPVVASAGSGAAESVRDGETGLLVPPGDGAALAAALERLLGDPALRRRMGAAARQYAEEEADAGRCAARLEGFFHAVLARRHAERAEARA